MNEEVLNKLADKLGVAVDVIWGALLRQAPIQAVSSLVFCVVWVSILIFGTAFIYRKYIASKSRVDKAIADEDFFFFSTMVGLVMILCWGITLGMMAAVFPEIIAGFFNPEYWALQQILK